MPDLLVDTDVLIDHLRGARALQPFDARVAYSVVTRAELHVGDRRQLRAVDTLLAPFAEIPVDRTVAELGGKLRREHGTRLADALIAATALVYGLDLFTRNIRDFAPIPRLRLHAHERGR